MPPKKSVKPTREPRNAIAGQEKDSTATKKSSSRATSGGKGKQPKPRANKAEPEALSSSSEDRLSSLPPEILKLTLDNIKDTPTINALSQTCKHLYPILMPRLYERVAVAAMFHAHIPKVIRALEPHLTIAQKKQLKKEGKYKGQQEKYPSGLDEEAIPTCASYVRQLIIGATEPGKKHKYIVDRYVEEAVKNMKNLEIVETYVCSGTMGQTLASLKHLKALRIIYSNYQNARSSDMTSLAQIKNLKHLRFDSYIGSDDSPEQILLRNSTSTLQTLVFSGRYWGSYIFNDWEIRTSDDARRFTTLKSLSLAGMQFTSTVVKSLDQAFDFMALRELTLGHYDDHEWCLLRHLTELASCSRATVKLRDLKLNMPDHPRHPPVEPNKEDLDARCQFLSSFDTLTSLTLEDYGQHPTGTANPGLPDKLLRAVIKHNNLRFLSFKYRGMSSNHDIPYFSARNVRVLLESLPQLREFHFAPEEDERDQIGIALSKSPNLEIVRCFPYRSWSRGNEIAQGLLDGVVNAHLNRPGNYDPFIWEENFKLKEFFDGQRTWNISSNFTKGHKSMAKPKIMESGERRVRVRDATNSLQGRIHVGYDPDLGWVSKVAMQMS